MPGNRRAGHVDGVCEGKREAPSQQPHHPLPLPQALRTPTALLQKPSRESRYLFPYRVAMYGCTWNVAMRCISE